MRRWKAWTEDAVADDRGSAALEFILVGLVLLVPVVYVIISLGLIQGQTLGVEAGARHIARTISNASDVGTVRERADRVLASVVEEYGLDPAAVEFSMACVPATAECPEPGATIIVNLSTRVALPLVPAVFGLERLASIPVDASAAQKASRFWGSE